MRRHIVLVAWALVGLCCATAAQAQSDRQTANANPAVADAARSAVLDHLIGAWSVRYEIIAEDGSVRRYAGGVSYQWILDGQALQETWTSDYRSADPRPYGTTIDFYDPKQHRWTAVWVYPAQGMTTVVNGGEVGGAYTLVGVDQSGATQRWVTTITGPNTAEGRFDISSDGGATWRVVGRNHMERSVQ